MSMALALARAAELNENQPEKQTEEAAMMPIPITNDLARRINIASGEDANFVDEAWDWKKYESDLLRNSHAF